MKKLAVLVYPECSIQEVSNTMYLFRWYFDVKTVIVGSTKEIVVSEEGMRLEPEITTDEFNKDDFHALILPGNSDFSYVLKDKKLLNFLRKFKEEDDFIIGAICSAPLLLSLTGVLENKKFTNSLWKQMNEEFSFIDQSNLVYAPLVVDGNIITAIGSATRLFALEVARKSGFSFSEHAITETTFENYNKADFVRALSIEDWLEVQKVFKDQL